MRAVDANRINMLIRKAGSVQRVELDSLAVVSERTMLRKLQSIMASGCHPLHNVLVMHRSTFSNRLLPPRCTTERHSFLSVAIKLYNSSTSGREMDSRGMRWLQPPFHFSVLLCLLLSLCRLHSLQLSDVQDTMGLMCSKGTLGEIIMDICTSDLILCIRTVYSHMPRLIHICDLYH